MKDLQETNSNNRLPKQEITEKFYSIELFTDKDQEEVKQLGLEVSKEIGQIYNPKLDYDWEHIKEVYIDSGGIFYVVKSSGKIIGCAGVKNINDIVAEFKRARVLKEFRGKGIGRDLFEKRLNFALANNFKKIILDTTDLAVQHLCEENRFQKIKQRGNIVYYEKVLKDNK